MTTKGSVLLAMAAVPPSNNARRLSRSSIAVLASMLSSNSRVDRFTGADVSISVPARRWS